jgi:hypothetical protein
METLLDRAGGPGLLFDADRASEDDRAIRVSPQAHQGPLWIIGDLHGDLLALEAALAHIDGSAVPGEPPPRIIFLGDFVDDEGYALELLVRLFELIVDAPERICVVAGNHDEALTYDGNRFGSSVSPADFSDFLNANLAHEWIERVGKLAIRLTAHAPRALFFDDGLLVSHGGFPVKDLHAGLLETGDWNDAACLTDFVWVRAHPKARRKMPNRFARGSQFGFEDFADFCAVSAELGRPVTHMVRGHDHVEERYAIFPAYRSHPVLTTVALSRRLPRESFGALARCPTLVRVDVEGLPQVVQLHIPFRARGVGLPDRSRGRGESHGRGTARCRGLRHERGRDPVPELRHDARVARRVRSLPRRRRSATSARTTRRAAGWRETPVAAAARALAWRLHRGLCHRHGRQLRLLLRDVPGRAFRHRRRRAASRPGRHRRDAAARQNPSRGSGMSSGSPRPRGRTSCGRRRDATGNGACRSNRRHGRAGWAWAAVWCGRFS